MRTSICMLAMLLPSIVSAGEGGIMESNGSIMAMFSDSNHYSHAGIGLGYRLPVGDYGGVVFAAAVTDTNGKDSYLNSTGQAAGVEAFLRKYDMGLVSASYSHGEVKADLNPGSLTASYDSYSVTGVYYFGDVDAMLGYTRLESDIVNNPDTYRVAGRLYLGDNVATELEVNKDDVTDTYGISFVYQPNMFANSVGVTAGYQSSDNEDTVSISIKYHFDTKVSLIERNRKY